MMRLIQNDASIPLSVEASGKKRPGVRRHLEPGPQELGGPARGGRGEAQDEDQDAGGNSQKPTPAMR